MSTVTLRDATDDLERRLAEQARSGGWLRAAEEDDDDGDLFGDDDLGFDDIDESDEDPTPPDDPIAPDPCDSVASIPCDCVAVGLVALEQPASIPSTARLTPAHRHPRIYLL